MRVLGVDPGVSGAYALLGSNGLAAIVDDLPVVNRQVDAAEWRRVIERLKPDIAVVEIVHSMPGQGVASTFKFGMAAGLIRGVLLGAGVPIFDAAPTVWKKHFKLVGSDGEKSRALAIQRFPTSPALARKKDHNRAEALLIALWRVETDQP
jgi:Holliday junction resolvasome RuvABC endonuclease subunit